MQGSLIMDAHTFDAHIKLNKRQRRSGGPLQKGTAAFRNLSVSFLVRQVQGFRDKRNCIFRWLPRRQDGLGLAAGKAGTCAGKRNEVGAKGLAYVYSKLPLRKIVQEN